MYRVDYVKTRTRGATVLELEEGTHTFAPTGHRRMKGSTLSRCP